MSDLDFTRDLTGIRVHHDSKLCCLPNAIVARVDNKCSAFELRCAECNSRICSLPKEVVSFLRVSCACLAHQAHRSTYPVP